MYVYNYFIDRKAQLEQIRLENPEQAKEEQKELENLYDDGEGWPEEGEDAKMEEVYQNLSISLMRLLIYLGRQRSLNRNRAKTTRRTRFASFIKSYIK